MIGRIFCLLLVFAALSGCNTLEGIGKDVQKGGKAIEKAAK
jgi:entericidin B